MVCVKLEVLENLWLVLFLFCVRCGGCSEVALRDCVCLSACVVIHTTVCTTSVSHTVFLYNLEFKLGQIYMMQVQIQPL